MCGRMMLFLGADVPSPRLLRAIPQVQIAIPAGIDRATLRKSISSWLDDEQRDCALTLWKRATTNATDSGDDGHIVTCS